MGAETTSQPSGHPRPEEGQEKKRRPRSLQERESEVNQQIEEAMRSGAFDNLPGKGKPLNLARNPFEPEELEIAHKLLKDNDLVPGWIAERNEVLAKIEALRTEMAQVWTWHRRESGAGGLQSTPSAQTEWVALQESWGAYLRRWQADIVELNKKIQAVNLTLPIWRMEVLKLRLEEELKRIGAPPDLGADDCSPR